MKTTIVIAIVILTSVFTSAAWLTARQDLAIVRATATYYHAELTGANSQIETANAELNKLASTTEEFKNSLELADGALAELRDKNDELRRDNHELKENGKLRYFESTDELKAFLEESDVDQRIYIAAEQDFRNYDCEDFAIALRDAALSKGFHMNIQALWRYRRPDTGELITTGGSEGHALNSAIINNELYFIEPQTDAFWLAAYLD